MGGGSESIKEGVYCYTQLWKMELVTIEKVCFEMIDAKGNILSSSVKGPT